MATRTGFFAALFDWSLTELLTTRVARAVYILAIAAAVLLTAVAFVYGLRSSPTLGIVLTVAAGVGLVSCLVFVRLSLEAVMVLSRIAAQTEEIAEQVAGIAVDIAAHSRVEGSQRA